MGRPGTAEVGEHVRVRPVALDPGQREAFPVLLPAVRILICRDSGVTLPNERPCQRHLDLPNNGLRIGPEALQPGAAQVHTSAPAFDRRLSYRLPGLV
jgi:hypothetical protein